MERKYCKLVYESLTDRIDVEEAINQNNYVKKYYLADNALGRVDYFEPGEGLVKVSYRVMDPPFDTTLEKHFTRYPNVLCEFSTPPIMCPDGLQAVHTYLFSPSRILEQRGEAYSDCKGRIVKRIELGLDGRRVSEQREIYDETGLLIKTSLYDANGNWVRDYDYLSD